MASNRLQLQAEGFNNQEIIGQTIECLPFVWAFFLEMLQSGRRFLRGLKRRLLNREGRVVYGENREPNQNWFTHHVILVKIPSHGYLAPGEQTTVAVLLLRQPY